MKILVAETLAPAALDRLRAGGHEVIVRTGLQGAELAAALDGCAALLVRGATKVTADVLRATRGLRAVARAGSGLDNVDVATARELGIAVVNAPAANTTSVAELLFALLLAFERHVAPAAADLRCGRWEKAKYGGREISGKRIGVIGFGHIGRAVARRARGFEMEVLAYDPVLQRWPEELGWARAAELDELLAESDYVSLHVPLVESTRNLIGAPQLARMKADAVLANVARGGVVDEAALHDALVAGHPRGAVLDVFAQEPAGAHPLLALSNVLATPHLGASTREAQDRAGVEAAERVLEVLNG